MPDVFSDYYCQAPEISPKEEYLYYATLYYIYKTETFDATLESSIKIRDSFIPMCGIDVKLSNNYAQKIKSRIINVGSNFQVSKLDIKKTLVNQKPLSQEHLQTILKRKYNNIQKDENNPLKELLSDTFN